jgi:chemotaxis signal transduction protein
MNTLSLTDRPRPAASAGAAALLLVRIGERRYGLPLGCVERVLPMARVLSLPGSGVGLLGMLNLQGQVLPVVDPHPRLGAAAPRIEVEHRLVLLNGGQGRFLVWVDEVLEVVSGVADAESPLAAQQATPIIERVLRLGDDMIPVLAPDALEPRGPLQ